jgi:O-antigen/teichoic acid export membrane protein
MTAQAQATPRRPCLIKAPLDHGASLLHSPPVKNDSVRPILTRVLANAGMLLGGRTVNAVVGLGYMALTARGLGVERFGVLVLIHAFAQFLGDVVKFQSWQTVLQYGAKPLAEGRTVDFQQVLRFTLLLDFASSVIGVGIGVVGALFFANQLKFGVSEAPAAAAYALSVAFMVSAAPLGLLRLFDRFDIMARQTALVSIVRLLGCAIAYGLHAPMEIYLLMWAIGVVVGFIYLVWESGLELHRRGLLANFTWRGPLTQGMPGVWRFAWSTNLAATLDVAFTHVATLVVGAMIGPAQAAFWRVGRQVADAIAKPAKLLTPALYPELARLRADSSENGGGERAMWTLAGQVGLLAGGVGVVLLALSAFGGRPLLSLILGKAFAPAADLMTWQVCAAAIGVFALPLEPMLVSLGRPGTAVFVRVVVGAIYLAFLPQMIRHFGAHGAAIALAISAAALAVGMLIFVVRESRAFRRSEKSACDPDAAG